MATPEQIDSLEASLSDWIGPTSASTLLQLLGSRPDRPTRRRTLWWPSASSPVSHDAMVEHGDHDLADGVLELARYPAKFWMPSCSALS